MKDYKKLFSALCLSACLAACSGGGGGNNTPQNPPRGNQPPQQTPPQGQQPQQPQQPDKGKNPQPQLPESGKKPEQPKLPDSGRDPQQPPQTNPILPQPPKVEAPQPEAKGYFTETINKDGKNADSVWKSATNITKDSIPVYKIQRINTEEVLTKELQRIKAPAVEAYYDMSLLGNNAFYGHYTSIGNNGEYAINYAYGFDKNLENKNVPSNITANYTKENGFLFFTKIPNQYGGGVHSGGNVNIVFRNGNIEKGEITSGNGSVKLFDIEKGKSVNQLIIKPTANANIDKNILQGDNSTADIHYLNSSKDTNDYKYLVGTVEAKNWYGVLAAEKQ
ncbi:hypothetical protein EDC45_0362 [Mesocricetibacter intestinalis]|uniref:Uncharacterized protein n=1 Tax=Mesocricetibacter intestinalis TaxID=1521930 RepID=A0A4R6VCP1_9PAST|nr:hypothetical protein [Mesocricetibacter intestinalis]TDQ59704.1 hypothetical protein EDC45_0362 [Mesocricetibacter intestinalis]